MKREQLKKHTYARWIGKCYDDPQLFGISRYSFVALTNTSNSYIVNHVKTMYYQMIVLSLMQRASVLRFSDEVKEISKLSENSNKQLQEIKCLNEAYLKFTNQMYFREVTAQEQGIELYDMIQQHMRIENDVKDLNREIDELYQFARLLEDEKERKQMTLISQIGAVLLLPALFAGIFGMNTFEASDIQTGVLKITSIVLTVALPAFAIVIILLRIFIKRKKSK